jgi:hypothetical protein
MLTNTDIVRKVKGAFLPMRCEVRLGSDDDTLWFRVLDYDRGVKLMPVTLELTRHEAQLDSALRQVHSRLRQKGYLSAAGNA